MTRRSGKAKDVPVSLGLRPVKRMINLTTSGSVKYYLRLISGINHRGKNYKGEKVSESSKDNITSSVDRNIKMDGALQWNGKRKDDQELGEFKDYKKVLKETEKTSEPVHNKVANLLNLRL